MDLFDIAVASKLAGGGGGGGGGSALTLLTTKDLGDLSVTSTSEENLNQSLTFDKEAYEDYGILLTIVEASEQVDGHLVATASAAFLGEGSVQTPSAKGEKVKTSEGLAYRTNNNAYGVYVKGSISSGTLTLTFYGRYSSLYTTTIDGHFTAKVYGLKYPFA